MDAIAKGPIYQKNGHCEAYLLSSHINQTYSKRAKDIHFEQSNLTTNTDPQPESKICPDNTNFILGFSI